MSKVCIIAPSTGVGLFNQVKKEYGSKAAWNVWKAVTNSKLAERWESLTKDSEGFPLFSELMKDKAIQYAIGEDNILGTMEDKFQEIGFTQSNYDDMLQEAYNFNQDPTNSDYIATVVETENGNIRMSVSRRTSDTIAAFNNQYSANQLNNRLATMFASVGITVGSLTEAETRAGRVGITDFSAAKDMANGFSSIIKIANNLEGNYALSEEFSHLLIGTFKDEPLIQRSINAINNEETLKAILGDEFDELMNFYNSDMSLVAEEALGQILRQNLLNEEIDSINSSGKNLLNRTSGLVKNKFKNFDSAEVERAIIEADNSMSQLAKNIMSGAVEVTQEKISKAGNRNVQFNALSDRIAHNIEILKNAKNTELKRYKISPNASNTAKEEMKELIDSLDRFSRPEADTVLGLFRYANTALETLKNLDALTANITMMPPATQFRHLRRVRSYIQSYGSFIESMMDEILESEQDSEASGLYDEILVDDEVVSLRDVIKDLGDMSRRLTRRYNNYSTALFSEFLKPFFGEEVKIKGKKATVEQLLKEADSDISISDRWLDSMADSSDTLLQLFNAAVYSAKDKARLQTIKDITEIQALMMEAQNNGIDNFNWMFEVDENGKKSGNYISEINYAKFDNAREKMEAQLEEKYGRHATGEAAKQKAEEKATWYRENTVGKDRQPNSKYRNQDFYDLSDTQKDLRQKILDIKTRLDSLYPSNRVDTLKAVQMRKSSGNRILESLGSPTTIIDNIKESLSQTFLDAEDDDTIFGERTKKGLTNFDGTEYSMLPVLYTARLRNPEELTTDVFASLIGYAYSANTYNEMDRIIDPLEVGRTIITDGIRKTVKTRGGKQLKERINTLGDEVGLKVFSDRTNIEDKLNDFFESQVYQKYLKDEGTFGNSRINISKTTSWILKANSLAQLGFNWLANTANVATGLGMGNIEAASSEFFGVSELAAADKEYAACMSDYLMELGNRVKTNKLSLFNALFDIRQNFGGSVKRNQQKSWLQKLFGENMAFLGQEAGDHWLYNRIAIARCKRIKVLVPKVINAVKRVRGLQAAQDVVEKIITNSESLQLTDDERYYTDPSGAKHIRVTSAIQANGENNVFSDTHEDGRPNNWITPSTNIGTGFDEMTRDFFAESIRFEDGSYKIDGKSLESVYPNADEDSLQNFAQQLANFKASLDAKGLTVISRNIVAKGYAAVNVGGKLRQIPVAGTLDLLAYDKEGNFYIYDMKTYRGNVSLKKKNKWSSQLSLYKKFLEDEYGIRVKETSIIPIKVDYPTPIGERAQGEDGTVEYTVQDGTNQLLADGEIFKDAQPSLEAAIPIATKDIIVDYNELDTQSKNLVTDNKKSYDVNDYNEMNLWDALQVVDAFEGSSNIKKLEIPQGSLMAETGEAVDIGKIGREIAKINQSLYGIYNDDDANAANRVSLGRIVQQYRKWMKPQFNRRFEAMRYDVTLNKNIEGYYRTVFRLANELRKGEIQLGSAWETMSNDEKANVKRAITEVLQLLAVFMLVRFVDWPDDKKRPWAVKMAEYMAKRELHELGGLAPSPMMVSELSKTIQSPFPCISTINSMRLALFSLIDPADWTNEIQSGPYKGMNNVQKYWLKAPIPGISQYRQIDKFMNEIDTSIQFYARPN